MTKFAIFCLIIFGSIAIFPKFFVTNSPNTQFSNFPLLEVGSNLVQVKILDEKNLIADSFVFKSYSIEKDVLLGDMGLSGFVEYNLPQSHKIIEHNIDFYLGTDLLGRDYFSRICHGASVSLGIGFMSVILSLIIGLTIGLIAGYFGGWVDKIFMYKLQVFWSLPTILLALTISLIVGKGIVAVLLAIGLTIWIDFARVVRSLVQSIKEKEFIIAAKLIGLPSAVIILRHILPNVMRPAIVLVVGSLSGAILLEAGLGFLGLSVAKPTPSWGGMLSEYRNHIFTDFVHLPLAPGICIALVVFSFFILGKVIRDHLDNQNG